MSKKKILIADDEPNIRLLVSGMLSKDYIVLKASDGEEAISIARSEKPDLILMDIMMPNVDGYTACHAIKTDPATKATPVVMLTGVGHELNRRLSQRIGAVSYVSKPFNVQDLLDTVKEYELAPCSTDS